MRKAVRHLTELIGRHCPHDVWLRREERRLRVALGDDWVERRLAGYGAVATKAPLAP